MTLPLYLSCRLPRWRWLFHQILSTRRPPAIWWYPKEAPLSSFAALVAIPSHASSGAVRTDAILLHAMGRTRRTRVRKREREGAGDATKMRECDRIMSISACSAFRWGRNANAVQSHAIGNGSLHVHRLQWGPPDGEQAHEATGALWVWT